jgi:hypothetical protein
MNDSTRFLTTHMQRRLFSLGDVDPHVFVDELEGYSLADVKAFALDPEVGVRWLAARSNWNIDANLQLTLANDPDEAVVMALLSRVDPGPQACRAIFAGPHVNARRDLARRNLLTELLLELAEDPDDATRELAQVRLVTRGVVLNQYQDERR